MAKQRILFISNLYPSPLFPNRATFNRQQIAALQQYYDIDVIAPIAWIDLIQCNNMKKYTKCSASGVYHPVFWYPPGCFRYFYGDFFYHSIKTVASRMLDHHKYDLIYASWLYPDGWAAARLAKRYRLPLFVSVLGTDANRLATGSQLARASIVTLENANKVICVSDALKNKLLQMGVSPDRLEVIYNGVDRSVFKPLCKKNTRLSLGVEPGEHLILYVGNLIKEKGLRELVKAYEKISTENLNTRLVIVGSGPFAKTMKQLVSLLPYPEKVHMTGSLPLEEVALWMNAATVLCLPSYREGLPNVILEALACGVPVIASKVGGILETAKSSDDVFLVEPRSVDSLVEAICEILKRGENKVDSSFIPSWQDTAVRLSELFRANINL